jgi:hypothetical protein
MTETLELTMRRRIENRDYEAVFAFGECFRFALRLHNRWGYEIHGIRAGPDMTHWAHVWAAKGKGIGIDIRGIYPEKQLAELANAGYPAKVEVVDLQEARAFVEARGYPQDFSAALDSIADWVIDTHERFNGAKPDSEFMREMFDVEK